MPGISFIYSSKEDLSKKRDSISKSLDSTLHFERYFKKVLRCENSYFLGFTAYNEYPMTSFENDDFFICLEGMIYNRQFRAFNKELNALAIMISSSDSNKKNKIKQWLLNIDGDFIIFIINKKNNNIYILNDALGRLPLYLYNNGSHLIISRELRFITNVNSNIRFDRMGIAQILLFSFTLGRRTLLENINRVEPASLIEINCSTSDITQDILHQFNFEVKSHSDKTFQANVSELVSLFSETCKNMAESFGDFNNVLALSGGLDSRAIAAALWKTNSRFLGVTRLSYDGRESSEVDIAKQVAEIFHMDWKVIISSPPTGKDMLNLLRTKMALNSLNVGLFIPYLNNVLNQYGNKVVYFTGEDGNYRLPDCRPPKTLKDMNELIRHVFSCEERWPLDNITLLTGIKKKDLIYELEERFLSYPEIDLHQKFIHFVNSEKSHNRNFESEDRNRFYFWSVSPYNSVIFYDYALNCPDDQKSNHQMHREFLMRLSSEAAMIANKDWGISIVSKKVARKPLINSIWSFIPRNVKDMIKIYMLKDHYDNDSAVMKCLNNQLENCDKISDYMSKKVLKSTICKLTKIQINNLFTITSIIEDLTDKKSVLEKYCQSFFV